MILRGWEIDLNRVIRWNLQKRSKTKINRRLAETARNDTALLQNKHYITTNKANHSSVFAKPGHKNQMLVQSSGHFLRIFVFSDSLGTGQEGHHKFTTQKLRAQNATCMNIYRNSVIHDETSCKNSMKIHSNLLKSIQFQ